MPGPTAPRPVRSRNGQTVGAGLRFAVALAVALSAASCAVSGVGSQFARGDRDAMASASPDIAGSVGSARLTGANGPPSDTDLIFTKLAIVEVLQHGSKESSVPWENPSNGARGTVTPIARAYQHDGLTCRDFLASYVRHHESEIWMQGEACRGDKGQWEVKRLRPWSRS
jgi:surface antigen